MTSNQRPFNIKTNQLGCAYHRGEHHCMHEHGSIQDSQLEGEVKCYPNFLPETYHCSTVSKDEFVIGSRNSIKTAKFSLSCEYGASATFSLFIPGFSICYFFRFLVESGADCDNVSLFHIQSSNTHFSVIHNLYNKNYQF